MELLNLHCVQTTETRKLQPAERPTVQKEQNGPHKESKATWALTGGGQRVMCMMHHSHPAALLHYH